MCGNAGVLSGPAAPGRRRHGPGREQRRPVRRPAARQHHVLLRHRPHYLGSGEFAQINPGKNDTFIGAPGAVISGVNPGSAGYHQNDFAFVGNDTSDTGVTIEYLTIENFALLVARGGQHQLRRRWTIAHSTIKDNAPGAAMMIGSGNTIEHNCLTANGQYAFNAYQNPGDPQQSKVTGGPQDIVLSGNEISYNDTCNWEASGKFPVKTPAGCAGAGQSDGCGCSGGGKFWQAQNVTVKNNYVHDNYNVGIWADTNDDGFDIEGNYFSANFDSALVYEISYNALIKGNMFAGNAVGQGTRTAGSRTPLSTSPSRAATAGYPTASATARWRSRATPSPTTGAASSCGRTPTASAATVTTTPAPWSARRPSGPRASRRWPTRPGTRPAPARITSTCAAGRRRT